MIDKHVKNGLRGLRKGGVSTVATILTLALGIGATGAMFSLLDGVLLSPLPYPDPESMVVAYGYEEGERINISPVTYQDWKAAGSFSEIAAYAVRNVSLTGEGNPEQILGAYVTSNYFDVLGLEADVGRTFLDEEGELGPTDKLILSHGVWQRRFGGDRSVVGRRLRLNGEPVTVVGVLPADYDPLLEVELWMPMPFDESELLEDQRLERYLAVVARLSPGTSARQADQELEAIARRIRERNPAVSDGWTGRTLAMKDAVVGDFKPVLYMLLAAAALVMLLVCANVTNLMTARYLERQGELALRTALGAGRGDLLRQLLVEACMLALVGGAIGLFLAWIGIRLLVNQGPQDIPRLHTVGLDGTVLVFVLFLSLLTGVVVGLLPALQVSRFSLSGVLKEGSTRSSASRSRNALRNALITSQVALAVALLIGAGLLVTSLRNLLDVDPGFRSDDVLVMRLVKSSSTTMDQARNFSGAVQERLEALPGVQEVAVTSNLPLMESRLRMEPLVEGRRPEEAVITANYEAVSPEYFRALDVDVVAGRAFNDADRADAPQVAIVNRALERRLWPDDRAMGSRISFDGAEGPWWTVVGVMEDVHRYGPSEEPPPQVVVPWAQDTWYFMSFAIRTSGSAESLMPAVRRSVWEVDGEQAIAILTTLDGMFADSMAQREFTAFLVTVFGIAALLLTAVGLYGVMAYLAAQRHREIAIRLALGAERSSILGLMLRRSLLLLAGGVAIGVVVQLLFSSFLERLLFDVSSTDVGTLVGVALLVALVTLAASFVPAFRSSRTDPALVLRQ